jgi:hypothetical protein
MVCFGAPVVKRILAGGGVLMIRGAKRFSESLVIANVGKLFATRPGLLKKALDRF